MAELGWRSVSFWIKYHRCRTLSRMLRAPASDLTHMTLLLRDDMAMLQSAHPEQSWLSVTLPTIVDSRLDSTAARQLTLFLKNRLPYVDFQDHEALAVELDRLHLEHTWCNAVFADELESWQVNIHAGATRRLYSMYVSERRDRGAALDPKPRWATVSRPPKALRHIAGKADAKLLTSTRMGDRRSLSAHVNPHTQTLGDACPCCHSAIDTAPHMLQCPAVKSDLRVQEALQQLKASMVGRPIRMRGSGDVELGLLVDFVAASHLNTGAEQVLLGSCSSQAVPPNLRNMYTALHSDRQLHALWLKGIVGVLRACWAVHDAAVDDALAASGGDDPPIPPESPPPHTRIDCGSGRRQASPTATW